MESEVNELVIEIIEHKDSFKIKTIEEIQNLLDE